MKVNNSIYILLIYFVIFLIIKNTFDTTMDVLYPTYEDVLEGTPAVKNAFFLRNILSILCVLFIFYLFMKYTLNNFLYTILTIVLITCIFFFLFSDRLIYYFIKQTNTNLVTVRFIDTYSSIIFNNVLLMYCLFIIIQIFRIN
jgi:hypothetical protein